MTSETDKLQRINLVYCVHRRADGLYVLVNRLYNRLGSDTREWEDFDALPGLDLRLNIQEAQSISFDGDKGLVKSFLYGDRCAPWLSPKDNVEYFHRLAELQAIAVARGISLSLSVSGRLILPSVGQPSAVALC